MIKGVRLTNLLIYYLIPTNELEQYFDLKYYNHLIVKISITEVTVKE